MMMNVEQSVEYDLARKTEVLGDNLPEIYFIHHKSHISWPGLESEVRGEKLATNRLYNGKANLSQWE
jgi:hypothetical protein